MRLKLASLGALAALVGVVSFTAATATAAPATSTLSVPITSTQSGGALNGVFTITGFALNQAGQLVANGVFNGTLTQGGVTQTLTDTLVSTVVAPTATGPGCQILDLTLGPLHLNLLGLVIDLNQVHLTITAQPGPGNLLGNLLCSVAHLLDNNGPLAGLQTLLNRLNMLLGGL